MKMRGNGAGVQRGGLVGGVAPEISGARRRGRLRHHHRRVRRVAQLAGFAARRIVTVRRAGRSAQPQQEEHGNSHRRTRMFPLNHCRTTE
jgi:hypothetical protein